MNTRDMIFEKLELSLGYAERVDLNVMEKGELITESGFMDTETGLFYGKFSSNSIIFGKMHGKRSYTHLVFNFEGGTSIENNVLLKKISSFQNARQSSGKKSILVSLSNCIIDNVEYVNFGDIDNSSTFIKIESLLKVFSNYDEMDDLTEVESRVMVYDIFSTSDDIDVSIEYFRQRKQEKIRVQKELENEKEKLRQERIRKEQERINEKRLLYGY